MNTKLLKFALVLIILFISPCIAHSGLLDETCSIVYKILGSGPYESLTKSVKSFEYDGRQYTGCVIHLSGNINKVTGGQSPDSIFGLPLPYCPDGKIPDDLPGSFINEGGWCGDKMADGPDGISYTAIKKSVFCSVEGRWDGGDDSDPGYAPSPRYEVIVKCAIR